MNDLIISGIDHGKFDIEWAKRGGWCIVRGEVCKLISKATYISSDTDTLFVRAIAERMATREECAVAGIEYIEPPARWLPINILTTDIPVPLIVCDKKSKERGVLTGENIFGGACISGWNDDNITPTHWMPLPQPPKDE